MVLCALVKVLNVVLRSPQVLRDEVVESGTVSQLILGTLLALQEVKHRDHWLGFPVGELATNHWDLFSLWLCDLCNWQSFILLFWVDRHVGGRSLCDLLGMSLKLVKLIPNGSLFFCVDFHEFAAFPSHRSVPEHITSHLVITYPAVVLLVSNELPLSSAGNVLLVVEIAT